MLYKIIVMMYVIYMNNYIEYKADYNSNILSNYIGYKYQPILKNLQNGIENYSETVLPEDTEDNLYRALYLENEIITNDVTYEAGTTIWYAGEGEWKILESNNINIGTGGSINILGGDINVGANSNLNLFSGSSFKAIASNEVLIATTTTTTSGVPVGNYIWMHSVNGTQQLDIGTTGKMAINADSLVIKIPTGEDENQNDTIIEYGLDDYISDLGPSESINRWFNFGDNGLTISATIGENENGDVIKSPWSTVIYEEGYKVCYEDQAVFNVQRDKSTLNAVKMGNIVIKNSQKGMVWVKEAE